jgi:hypothetical protein
VILFLAFVVGWICAKLIGQYAFTTADMPYVMSDNSPRTKILVAKTAIPVGAEILAEHVSFVDVPVSELPAQAIASFNDVYRRRPAFPIPVNCPICEDLLITKDEEQKTNNANKFISVNHRIISFDIDWKNKRTNQNLNNQVNNNTNFLPTKNNTDTKNIESEQIFQKGNRVDIRVITRRTPKGTLANIKEQVLKTYADKFDLNSVSELVLENVEIYGLSNYGYGVAGNNLQKISFLLDESKIEQLTNAAKKGRLRIVAHQQNEVEPIKFDETIQTKSIATEEPIYKGYRSYVKKVKTKSQTSELAETKPNKTETITNTNNNTEITQTTNKEILPTPKIQITSPITETKSDSKSIAVAPSFWDLPFYLRNLFDYQLPQNTNNTNSDHKTTHTAPEIKIDNHNEEIIGLSSSNNIKINSTDDENHTINPTIVNNNNNLVFTKPQVKDQTEQNTTNDDTGWATTKKYALGNIDATKNDK